MHWINFCINIWQWNKEGRGTSSGASHVVISTQGKKESLLSVKRKGLLLFCVF